MGFLSKIFNPGGRTARLEKLQSELCADRERYSTPDAYQGHIMDSLTDALSGNGPSQEERRAKDQRLEAAKSEYLELCVQDRAVAVTMESFKLSKEDLWKMSEELAKEGLAGKVKGKWMHLEAIAYDFPIMLYFIAKDSDISTRQVVFWLMDYYKGRADEVEILVAAGAES